MNSPSAIKPLIARAAAPAVSVGRMIEQIGNLRLRKIVGLANPHLTRSFADPHCNGQHPHSRPVYVKRLRHNLAW